MSTRHGSINAKQRRFAQEYVVDFNATRAAERAGYSSRTARQMGAENLSKPVIRKAIDDEIKQHSIRLGLSIELENDALGRLLKADISQIFDRHNVPKPVEEWPEEFRIGGLVKAMKIRVEETPNGAPKVRIYSITLSDRLQLIKEMGRRVGAWGTR
ncbi:MAG: terminase small subunit [Hyphomonadaceae bacterium]